MTTLELIGCHDLGAFTEYCLPRGAGIAEAAPQSLAVTPQETIEHAIKTAAQV